MTRDLVLAGGGHAHVEVVRLLAGVRDSDLKVILVSPHPFAPYSGMLPGLVAGHYSWRDCHIDLEALCRRAGVRLIQGSVTSLDVEDRAISLHDGAVVRFDLLSLNTGSTPETYSVPGADRFATPIKPMSEFLEAWDPIRERYESARDRPFSAVVVGAGAGGVEVALALRHRLSRAGGAEPSVTLAGEEFLGGYPGSVKRSVRRALERAHVLLLEGVRAKEVTASRVSLSKGHDVDSEFTVWAIGASAPAWIAESGLATDDRGFLAVDSCLRSRSDERVFAAGDLASLSPSVPKAGVYAVRQAPVLFRNLLAAFRGTALERYVPQPRFLSLISLGDRRAVASWGVLKAEGALIWRLKDYIDRKFMRRYVSGGAPESSH